MKLTRRMALTGAAGLAFTATSGPATAAMVPPAFINAVVAIGVEVLVDPLTGSPVPPGASGVLRWFTEGTGFIYGEFIRDAGAGNKEYRTFLVTARHVIEHHPGDVLGIRFNPSDQSQRSIPFGLPMKNEQGEPMWFYHPNPNVDVAIIPVDLPALTDAKYDVKTFQSDESAASKAKMQELGVSAGDGVFVLGFPMDLAGADRNFVIVRQGVVARIDEMLAGASSTFLIDSFVFPGNSGGPVILKPELASIQGTKSLNRALLAGMVVSYLPYSDTAFSQQTRQPRIVFEENSGLAQVLPVDVIDQAIQVYINRPTLPAPPKTAPSDAGSAKRGPKKPPSSR